MLQLRPYLYVCGGCCVQLYVSVQDEPWDIPRNVSYQAGLHGKPGDIRIALGKKPRTLHSPALPSCVM